MANIIVQIWLTCLKIIFTFLHLLYSGLQYFDLVWSLFKRKIELLHSGYSMNEELYIAQCMASFEKRPRHLVLILGSEIIQPEDLANIIVWCLAAGISFLSIYDRLGVTRENEAKLYSYVMNRIKTTSTQVKFRNTPTKNGTHTVYDRTILVSILSEMDGKEHFTDMVKRFIREERKPSDLNIDVINGELKSESKFPDPDLAILVGPAVSTFGFSPWQIPVTEFAQIRSLKELKMSNFCSVLSKFSSCQQRYGK